MKLFKSIFLALFFMSLKISYALRITQLVFHLMKEGV